MGSWCPAFLRTPHQIYSQRIFMGVKSPSQPGHTSKARLQPRYLETTIPQKKWHHRHGKPTLGLQSVGHFPSGNPGEPLDFHNDFVAAQDTYDLATRDATTCVFFDVGEFMWVKPIAETIPQENHHFKSWYVYHSQSWVVHGYGMVLRFCHVLPTVLVTEHLPLGDSPAKWRKLEANLWGLTCSSAGSPRHHRVLILKRSNDLDDLGQVKLGCQ